MGNWNRRRWIPRKKYKQEDLPPSQPYQYNQSPYHAIQENSAPLWEIDFCRVAGIPWHKVVSAKTYMDCYENVVKWDDSAGQEAFNVAKRRYWAKISGFPPQNPPPNPDLYIDKVDWDSAIDPELILDLDREYFNPNEVKNSVKSENNLDPGCTLVWEDKTADNGENPWGSGNVQGSKTAANGENPWESGNVQDSKPVGSRENPWESASIEDTKQTWNEWYTPVNIKNDNPWERSSPKTQGILKGTAWGGCGNESWGWNSGMNYQNGYACVDNSFSNLWHQSGACVSGAKGNEWVDNSVGSWGQTYWNTGGHEQRNSVYGSRWNRNFSRGGGTTSKDRRWRGSEGTSWDYQQQPRQSNGRNVDFGRPSRGDNTFYSGSRKRDSSSQHVPRYKSSRFQSDEQRTANNWREENTQKRVTFNSMYD